MYVFELNITLDFPAGNNPCTNRRLLDCLQIQNIPLKATYIDTQFIYQQKYGHELKPTLTKHSKN